jgi:hypothetical protein
MKKNLPFFIFFVLALNIYCQPAIKVFAFEQESLPGTIPAGIKDENGNPIKKAAAQKNYFIFLSFKKKYDIAPIQVFVKGKPFNIQATYDRELPVEYTDNTILNNREKTILVPKTKNKVIEIKLMEISSQQKEDPRFQELADSNDVVIAYTWKKKKHFVTLKSLKTLKPLINE